MLLTIVVFLLLLGILVFVHELGHFLAAKATGMKVNEFSIGFPPRIWSRQQGETKYTLGAIPFGGYVKIQGEEISDNPEDEPIEQDPRSFDNKKVRFRAVVICAGVIMNLLFAYVVLCIAFSLGFSSVTQDLTTLPGAVVTDSRILVAGVKAGAPADLAGVKAGDLILGLTGPDQQLVKVTSIAGLQAYTKQQRDSGAAELQITLEREGKELTLSSGLQATEAPLGVMIEPYNTVRVPFWQAPKVAAKEMWAIMEVTFKALLDFFGKIFLRAQLAPEVSGPIGIYQATAVATAMGFAQVVFLAVMLSINLALLNILPIPALDGGRLLFLLLEGVCRKKVVRTTIEHWINLGGFAAMMILLLVLTVRDVFRLF